MALQDAVVAARHTGQQITWNDAQGNAKNLTGAIVSGRIRNKITGQARAIVGTLDLVTPASGIFSWEYATEDVAESGDFLVQFVATFGAANDKSFAQNWKVHEAL